MLGPLRIDRFVVPCGKYLVVDLGSEIPARAINAYVNLADDASSVDGTLDVENSNDLSSWTTNTDISGIQKNYRKVVTIPAGSTGAYRYVRFKRGTLKGPIEVSIVSACPGVCKALEGDE